MLAQLFDTACHLSPDIRRFLIRNWFQYLSALDKDAYMTCMNLGYVSLDPHTEKITLNDEDIHNHYCLQMYHHVVHTVNLEGLDVLEVGCGRGGGASYVKRYLKPRSLTGVDISKNAVTFCNNFYRHIEGMRFLQGDAENLPLADNSFDVIINIESSYGYGRMKHFLAEAVRVLRPGGYLLFADYRNGENIVTLQKAFLDAGLTILNNTCINANVLKALDLDHERKQQLIEQKVPPFLRKVFFYFAAQQGSEMYRSLKTGTVDYRSFVLSKGTG